MVTVIVLALLTLGSMLLAGRVAARRGRSVKAWSWLAAFLGPIALVILLLVPASTKRAAA
jgi:hypothetical protein